MRVHACRHCGDVFPSYPDLRQHLDSHLQPPNVCPTCKRSCTRTADLRRHSSRCRPKPFACDVCRSSFTRKRDLDRHTNTVRCGAWIPRKLTEGPTRPLVNMGDTSPSEYYFLPKETLKDISYNVIFDNGGIGYDLLPTPMKLEYEIHISTHAPQYWPTRL